MRRGIVHVTEELDFEPDGTYGSGCFMAFHELRDRAAAVAQVEVEPPAGWRVQLDAAPR